MGGSATLWWGLLFGSIGMGYFIYGKKQQNLTALVAGIALMALPYFVSNGLLVLLIGLLLMAVPYVQRE